MQQDPKGTHLKPKGSKTSSKIQLTNRESEQHQQEHDAPALKGQLSSKKAKIHVIFLSLHTSATKQQFSTAMAVMHTRSELQKRVSLAMSIRQVDPSGTKKLYRPAFFFFFNVLLLHNFFVTDSQSEERRLKLKGMGAKTACFREKINTGVAPRPGIE